MTLNYYYNYYNAEGERIIPGYTFDQVISDSAKVEPGYIPRPADQRVYFGLFFQDYQHCPREWLHIRCQETKKVS